MVRRIGLFLVDNLFLAFSCSIVGGKMLVSCQEAERERGRESKVKGGVLYDPLGRRIDQDSTNNPSDTPAAHCSSSSVSHNLPSSFHSCLPSLLPSFQPPPPRYRNGVSHCFPILLASSKNPHRRLDVHTHNKWLYSMQGGAGSQAFSGVNLLIRPHRPSPSHTNTHLNMTSSLAAESSEEVDTFHLKVLRALSHPYCIVIKSGYGNLSVGGQKVTEQFWQRSSLWMAQLWWEENIIFYILKIEKVWQDGGGVIVAPSSGWLRSLVASVARR